MVDLAARRLRAVEHELRKNADDSDAEAAAIAARGAAALERWGRYLEANDAGFRSFALAVSALALGFTFARSLRSLGSRGSGRGSKAPTDPQPSPASLSETTEPTRRGARRAGRNRRNGTVDIHHGT